ncbi:maltose alpha-D-glucosyltransferase/alpha-amylase [Cuniculiplasma divulgatum]|jgi:maltose alpha-D-glucosyltransferase/alpha-amylase|uniref:maltose alpha-D-glucosyltransferase n=2 Tax=Cuniculiplasma divulgatum TaxID=1673428 RepID=A0A1N5WQB6_9ARCH|nr:maltose alpha-D-glucosyltransferase/alpha-amylase [Cuniculiplasma divulgatum]SJK85656.1 maltose alpha-D-glucosyltransferase/alpha-amylase [Cuniculiplasma divulgatum]
MSDSQENLWYKDAIFYEVPVRSFYDSNGDGIGDFPGLTQKLDYIKSLGIDCIWLLPFYDSPLKDDGYDIRDYYSILPEYGTLKDFDNFMIEAHRLGIRVIADLVLNHVSDQIKWFQEARKDRTNSKRDWFVWSDTPDKYEGVRIIFIDTERSNWTLDPQTGQYYWHRFFSHQPDLNYDNPEVRDEMKKVIRFWLDRGLDGFRCDAVPYLFEREGTSCENLPETHEYFREIRKMIDEEYPGRILLAEANQWPEDAKKYFGNEDEFQMNFNFPLMPRIFIALAKEDAFPVENIISKTLPVPEKCSWGLFLRNHDELTLEMVSDEERDIMYSEYAKVPKMRLNLGIRRRLAPLVDNDRYALEFLNALIMSLPGSPILYYGDEINMGDNIYLGDRNGVRTPMQWSYDRNAGFSRSDPEQLYAPVIINSNYHYEVNNVESMSRLPSSFLNWLRKLIITRKRSAQVFGRGTIEFIHSDQKEILAFIRAYENQVILCVYNLSRKPSYVTMDLRKYSGWHVREMISLTRFPDIGELPYFFTLQRNSFFWMSLEKPDAT